MQTGGEVEESPVPSPPGTARYRYRPGTAEVALSCAVVLGRQAKHWE